MRSHGSFAAPFSRHSPRRSVRTSAPFASKTPRDTAPARGGAKATDFAGGRSKASEVRNVKRSDAAFHHGWNVSRHSSPAFARRPIADQGIAISIV